MFLSRTPSFKAAGTNGLDTTASPGDLASRWSHFKDKNYPPWLTAMPWKKWWLIFDRRRREQDPKRDLYYGPLLVIRSDQMTAMSLMIFYNEATKTVTSAIRRQVFPLLSIKNDLEASNISEKFKWIKVGRQAYGHTNGEKKYGTTKKLRLFLPSPRLVPHFPPQSHLSLAQVAVKCRSTVLCRTNCMVCTARSVGPFQWPVVINKVIVPFALSTTSLGWVSH